VICAKNQVLFDVMSEISIHPASVAQPRGRPANASREDVLALATRRYLRGRRVDVQAIAGELGLGRTTIYRWFGSRDELIGEVLVRAAEPLLERARAGARGTGGGSPCSTPSTASTAVLPTLWRCGSSSKTSAMLRCA
jgi:AcrR family transcriptional regulator